MRRLPITAALAALMLLSACAGDDEPDPAGAAATPSAPSSTGGTASAVPSVEVAGVVAEGLEVPWGLATLPDGGALVAERDSGKILRLTSTEPGAPAPTEVGTVPGVRAGGEGGLLGIVAAPDGGRVYAYFTAATDNRVVSMPFADGRLGEATVILDGIPKAGNHNGGRMAFGPDGNLWIGTGDGGERSNSQNRDSLGGKVLRIAVDGSVPAGNPWDTPVFSLGHRNVQGISFAEDGSVYAAEFGQNTYDELNQIRAGQNYGWPEVEGVAGDSRFVDPVVTWTTEEASPSGIAIVDDVVYVASLRGARLWQVPLATMEKTSLLEGEYGRLRTVEPIPDGSGLLLATSNRDGRGSPADADDRILRLTLS